MRQWQRRALIYRFFDTVPGGHQLFELVRMFGGGLRNFDVGKRKYAIFEMCNLLSSENKSVAGQKLVEIGSGWHPVLPALFYAMGASSIIMTDIVRHMRQDYVESTIDYLIQHTDVIAEITGISGDLITSRWMELKPGKHSWLDVWQDKGIVYEAPFDFAETEWPSDSVDMIYSNSCLGYIPLSILEQIFKESARLLRPGGWIAHDISVYDDYSAIDKSITPLNFLGYSEAEWERMGNSRLHYQNRLRPQRYFDLAQGNDLQILVFRRLQKQITTAMLDRSKLDTAFQEMPDEELLCAHLLLLAEKPAN